MKKNKKTKKNKTQLVETARICLYLKYLKNSYKLTIGKQTTHLKSGQKF